jgi:hypothetical protein
MRKEHYKSLYEGKIIDSIDDEYCSSIVKNLSDYVYRMFDNEFSDIDMVPLMISKGIVQGIDDHIKLFNGLKDLEKKRVRRYLIKKLIRNLKGELFFS